ncbi:uncharacterized protein NECHADRAFT_75558 [Fusarium vanettenii 77-13-4]|uniref:Uncharacterized protein n=1 Tax=Fusarium vanettenii (strain ATCC MYA-4622 / CBS 123669 / FGSC 9596 / NRRL 45880 / 77-13-4) TaxID=660122 RepID=C7YJ53_FUSV7|nr:uncharacterized protein NECHADRAFT_75558 [Fusarium vanettenii 77-13-4]EEU48923.1 predicted protein [Fusarium vanettenii 77-13-4]
MWLHLGNCRVMGAGQTNLEAATWRAIPVKGRIAGANRQTPSSFSHTMYPYDRHDPDRLAACASQAQEKIDSFARQYLELHPNSEKLSPRSFELILSSFMDRVNRDWDGRMGRVPTLDYHNPLATSAVIGVFSQKHPDEDLRGKKARLGVQAFDPQRHRIYWAYMNEQGTYQPQSTVEFGFGHTLETARKAAAEAYDKAEHEAVRQHNINLLIYMARRELLVAKGRRMPMDYGSPLVTEINVSWMLSLGRDFLTHITAHSTDYSIDNWF